MINKSTWKTPFGKTIEAYWRQGKNDWNTLQSILVEDEYALKKLCPSPSIVVDIGGHIGGFGLLAASQGAKIIKVVEILPENIKIINDSALANNFTSITTYNKAISDKSGSTIKAYYMDTDTKSGNHHQFVGSTEQDTGGLSFKIDTISLDDLLKDVDKVDILKVDCEGGEWPMFMGASPITLAKINLIVGEIHPWKGKTIEDLKKLLPNFNDISRDLGGTGQAIDLIAFKRK